MSVKRALGIFAKSPAPGNVKTRLAVEIGEQAAAEAYKEMAALVFAAARALAQEDIAVRVFFEGDPADPWVRETGFEVRRQAKGDLGKRMGRALDSMLQEGFAHVALIGTDSPRLSAARLREAFEHLASHDAVFGPAEDGGYYLVGLSRPEYGIFDEVEWSTPIVLAATIRRAKALGLTHKLLEWDFDVDTLADLKRWKKPS